jgi:thiosulfate/3-mercaptopyruvate sulfurtransferase
MARSILPIVSTDWLATQMPVTELVVVDIREPHLYAAGHIPGAISIPFSPVSDWATSTDELLLELPEEEDLLRVVGDNGMNGDSKVVLVGTKEPAPAPPYALADAPRVAATLLCAGVENVAVLDGGHPKWEREGREITTAIPEIVPLDYAGALCSEMFVSTDYVKTRIGRAVMVDGRDADQYFGVTVCPFAGVAGHIPTARNLPAVWMWSEDGTYKPVEVLEQMAAGVIGRDKDQEVVTYCGVGGYAAAWWFVLTQILGYTDVKIYDGAAEAWAKDNDMVLYTWTS